jgi:glycosidase
MLTIILNQSNITHEFVYRADKELTSVSVAGTFNNWNKDADRMSRDADGMTWRLKKSFEPGRYSYKFVLNGDTWITDPKSWKDEGDGNGNTNSILPILPADYASPASSKDGSLAVSALDHQQRPPALNLDRGRLTLSFRLRPGDARKVEIVVNGKPQEMPVSRRDDFYEHRRIQIKWDGHTKLNYVFRVEDGAKSFEYGADGLHAKSQPFQLDPKTFKPFQVPEWAQGEVFYQIFPERFRNGSKANDPKGAIPWDGEPTYANFMGGDISGIREKAGYLKGLGIGAIYLNPIFKSPSNHGYETSDYHQVEPRFGTNQEFVELTKELHQKKIRTVLDGVFNHTATNFAPFDDIVQNGQNSAFKNWFFIKEYPVVVRENPPYEAWFGYPSMPKLNVENPDAQIYLFKALDYWKAEADIDGWRLDVANEVSPSFWRSFRKKVKAESPDMWIVGEVWGDGTLWLGGDQWDSIMGYQFREAALGFIARGETKPSQYLDRLFEVFDSYPPQVARSLMSLLGSHDTARFLTECKGDKALDKLGATMLLTWPGSPSIYYGDELGMEGGADPDNRRGMRWDLDTIDNELLKHYKKLIAMRQNNPALKKGDPVRLQTDDQKGTFAFGRIFENQAAVVAVNRSTSPQTIEITLPKGWPDWSKTSLSDALGNQDVAQPRAGHVRISLVPLSAAVILPASGKP